MGSIIRGKLLKKDQHVPKHEKIQKHWFLPIVTPLCCQTQSQVKFNFNYFRLIQQPTRKFDLNFEKCQNLRTNSRPPKDYSKPIYFLQCHFQTTLGLPTYLSTYWAWYNSAQACSQSDLTKKHPNYLFQNKVFFHYFQDSQFLLFYYSAH